MEKYFKCFTKSHIPGLSRYWSAHDIKIQYLLLTHIIKHCVPDTLTSSTASMLGLKIRVIFMHFLDVKATF